MEYSIEVKREVRVLVCVNASTKEEALEKYHLDEIIGEDYLDSTDIEISRIEIIPMEREDPRQK